MWTAPPSSGFEYTNNTIACNQMSGLFVQMKTAGRDGVRYTRSKHIGDIVCASAIFGISRVPINRWFHLLVPASSVSEPSGLLRWPVAFYAMQRLMAQCCSVGCRRHLKSMSRQAMRANLFASATATSFGGLRSNIAASQGEGFVRPFLTCLSSAVAPTMRVDRIAGSPALVMPPSLTRPPVE
jgi:hypothetical protein